MAEGLAEETQAPGPVCGIYAIRSKNRSYIGQSINIQRRWIRHKYDLRKGTHGNQHLQRAWNKYGEDSFEFLVLEECAVELLLEREQHYFNQFLDKYNSAPAAGSCLGIVRSDETREKIRLSKIGSKHTPEAKEKIRQAAIGRKVSIETREKLREAARGHMVSDETREKIRISNLGRKASQETRDKISTSKIGNTNCVGRVLSDKSKARISASNRGRKHTAEAREKISAAGRDRIVSPETRAKISSARKAYWARKRAEEASGA